MPIWSGTAVLSRLTTLERFRRLRALRKDVIDPVISEHGGSIVQTGGDSLLIVFDSIDGAVRCAMTMQQQIPIHDREQATERAIRFRIGINIGDVIADGLTSTATWSTWQQGFRPSVRRAASACRERCVIMSTAGSISVSRSLETST